MNRAIAATVGLAVLTQAAHAHDPVGGNSFWSALAHPWLVPAHALALIGLALLNGLEAAAVRRLVVAGFAAGVLAGSFALTRGVGETPAPVVILSLAALSGVLAAAAWSLPALVTAAIAVAGGAAIALDSPPQAVTISGALLIQLGTGFGALLTLLLLGEIAASAQRDWLRIGRRVLGAWVAASAILVLALRLAR